MKKLKEIEQHFGNNCWRTENGQHLVIRSCAIGDNFYDYGESEPSLKVESQYSYLLNDPRIIILRCDECCGCAGW